MLFKLAGVSVAHPDGRVREVVYPAVGEQTLKDLVAEAKATESRRRAQVRTVLTSSYSHHYRTMLPKLLEALAFRCNNTAYRPVMDAVDLLHRYKDRDGRLTHYEPAERVPLDGVVKTEWRAAVVDERGRVERISYELCALGALRAVAWSLRSTGCGSGYRCNRCTPRPARVSSATNAASPG